MVKNIDKRVKKDAPSLSYLKNTLKTDRSKYGSHKEV
jgi:hypothetical protein